MSECRPLIEAVRRGLAARADPERARPMQRYTKSALPYYGVQAPGQREVFRKAFETHALSSFDEWRNTVLTLWREARFREERYGAIALTGDRRYRSYQTLEALSMYDELIATGAWWDYVDEIAIRRLGPLLRAHASPMTRTMRSWSRDGNLWRRRSSIICQIKAKGETDVVFLADCLQAILADREFFIRKAIGWALREYAKADADWVRRFVREHESELSPLSRREALKDLR